MKAKVFLFVFSALLVAPWLVPSVEFKKALSFNAALLTLSGFLPYIRAVLKGDTKPAKASWLIWATLDTVLLAGMLAKGTENGQMIGAVLGVWIVAILALKKGTPGWKLLDKLCLSGGLTGIVLWIIFSDPILCIASALTVLFVGSVPTFVSAWKKPEDEDRTAWVIWWISCIFTVAAIVEWTFAEAAQPITFLVVETIMMYILFIHARKIKGKLTPAKPKQERA